MEEPNYQQAYQATTEGLELLSFLPVLIGISLLLFLYLKKGHNLSAKIMKFTLCLLYIYTGIVYCSWIDATVLISYTLLLLVNLDFHSIWSCFGTSKYIRYSHSDKALCLPLCLFFSIILPDSNSFPTPYLLFAYSYCLLARLQLVPKVHSKSLKIHVIAT